MKIVGDLVFWFFGLVRGRRWGMEERVHEKGRKGRGRGGGNDARKRDGGRVRCRVV